MQTLVAYVENKPGVLNRVASLARRLAINIDSLTVGPTENEEIARMTIVAHTDEKGAHRLEASLEKLVDVRLAENISGRGVLQRPSVGPGNLLCAPFEEMLRDRLGRLQNVRCHLYS